MTLTDPFEVIAAFVDGERVDPALLKSALALPDGRDYLVNMIALREVVMNDTTTAATVTPRPARRWLVAAAAAIVLSLGGGYALGHRLAVAKDAAGINHTPTAADVAAPPPTRVIDVTSGSSYVSQGGK
jgi:hypothetical protein